MKATDSTLVGAVVTPANRASGLNPEGAIGEETPFMPRMTPKLTPQEFSVMSLLTANSGKIKYGRFMKQFVLLNKSGATVFLQIGGDQALTGSNLIPVATDRMFVSPGVGFEELSWSLSGAITAAPVLFAYDEDKYSPTEVTI